MSKYLFAVVYGFIALLNAVAAVVGLFDPKQTLLEVISHALFAVVFTVFALDEFKQFSFRLLYTLAAGAFIFAASIPPYEGWSAAFGVLGGMFLSLALVAWIMPASELARLTGRGRQPEELTDEELEAEAVQIMQAYEAELKRDPDLSLVEFLRRY